MESEYVLRLSPAAYLKVETPDGQHSARLDVFAAWRFLAEAQQQPSEEKRWALVRTWLANQLACTADEIAESTARQIHEVVCELGTRESTAIKKNASSIASSPQPIPASPATT